VAVSTTISPVQLTAEAAVKRASVKGADWPELLACGIKSNEVPINIRAAKAVTKTMKKGGFLGKYSSRGVASWGCFLREVTLFNPDDSFLEVRRDEEGFSRSFPLVEFRLLDLGFKFFFRSNSL